MFIEDFTYDMIVRLTGVSQKDVDGLSARNRVDGRSHKTDDITEVKKAFEMFTDRGWSKQ